MKTIKSPHSRLPWNAGKQLLQVGSGRLACAGLALCGLLLLEWWVLEQARGEREDEIRRAFQAFIVSTRDSLDAWVADVQRQVNEAAETPEAVTAIETLLQSQQHLSEGPENHLIDPIRRALSEVASGHSQNTSDFLLVSSRGRVLASSADQSERTILAGRLLPIAQTAMNGNPTARFLGTATPIPASARDSQPETTLAVAVPVRASSGSIVAALVFEVAVSGQPEALLARHPLGESAGAFLFSPQGAAIFSSRTRRGALTPRPRPTADLAGHPAAEALSREQGAARSGPEESDVVGLAADQIVVDLHGYRGVQHDAAVGAWCLLPDLGLALVAEIDSAEAWRPVNRLRTLLITLTLVSFLCLILLTKSRESRLEAHHHVLERRRKNSSAWAILAVSLVATALTWITTKSSVDKHDRTRFETEVQLIRDGWLDRMQRLAEALRTLRTAYHALGPAEDPDWIQFVESLELKRAFPEIGHLGFVAAEPAGHSDPPTQAFLHAERPARTSGEEALRFPVQFLELEEEVFADPGLPWGQAAREARDTGRITLARSDGGPADGGRQRGVVMLAAVFGGGAVPPTLAARRAAHSGWMTAHVRLEEIGQAIMRPYPDQMTLALYEGEGLDRQAPMYRHGPLPEDAESPGGSPRFEQTVPLEMGSTTWKLHCVSTSGFGLPITKNHPAQVLLGGLAISILLFDIALIMDSTRSRALAIAELMTRRLRDSETRIRAVVDNAPDGIITFTDDGVISTFNRGAESLFGYSAAEVRGRRLDVLMPFCLPPQNGSGNSSGGTGNQLLDGCREVIGHRSDGTSIAVELTVSEMRVGDRRLYNAIVRDISARKRAEEALRESEERYALAARAANDGLWDWNVRSGEIYFSPRWKAMLGLNEDEIGNRPADWLDRVHPDDRTRLRSVLVDHLEDRTSHFEAEYRILHKDGRYRWMLNRGIAVRNEAGQAIRIAGSQAEITARKEAEMRLMHDALYDSLTGLPNRAHFVRQLERVLKETQLRSGSMFALLFLDLDRFKVVNDSLGHYVGDQLLVAISDRLKGSLRPADTIARLGGDEFAILLANLSDVEEATTIAERIQKDLARPFHVGQHEVFTAASIGITLSSEGLESTESLLRDADTAMYRAKADGKGRYELFDQGMHTRAVERLFLETSLRRALERNEFRIHYQPIVSLQTGEITACEALIRWEHPERGLVFPNEFVPVAEETGLITPMSEWLLRDACAQMKEWRARGLPPIRLSVNISPRQIKQQNLYQVVMDTLGEYGLDPSMLQLELTESSLMENADYTIHPLVELYGKGVQIALDDFGTGYSSLVYLRRFPINCLKIDGAFVRDIASDPGDAAITSGLIALGHSLRLRVVVEGVETREQWECLQSHGCDEVQGYYISRPVPADEFAELLGVERPAWVASHGDPSEQ